MKALLLIFVIFFSFWVCHNTNAQTTKANIGIILKKGNEHTRIKSVDRAKVNDKFKIVVVPLNDSYNYVLYSDGNETTLLNSMKKTKAKDKLILPSPKEYFEFDDQNDKAYIFIINSTNQIKDIESLFKNSTTAPHKKWQAIEDKIIKENKSQLNDDSDNPISIAGNVRSIDENEFDKLLQTFTDKKLIFKKYKIEIKK